MSESVSKETYDKAVAYYQNENKRLREALKFYADKDNYKVWRAGLDPELEHVHDVDFDSGHKARKALKGDS